MIFTECGKHSIFDARLHYLAIAWFHHVTFYFYHVTFIVCIILDILENVWKFLLSFLITLTIHFLDILDDVWKFLLLFLITLTIHLLSPRNYSFKTFLTSEKIKEILIQWKKVILSDSVMSHQKSDPEIRKTAWIQFFQLLKCSHVLDQSLKTV